jgi:hypothetical protein
MLFHERLSDLQAKHDYIDCQIRQEMNRPIPSNDLIRDLRKRKLRLKEQIVTLML